MLGLLTALYHGIKLLLPKASILALRTENSGCQFLKLRSGRSCGSRDRQQRLWN
tara:strand:- start:9477 stop:9638 length:162 start_codon:yes stop_codon:yes gene_type:complete